MSLESSVSIFILQNLAQFCMTETYRTDTQIQLKLEQGENSSAKLR